MATDADIIEVQQESEVKKQPIKKAIDAFHRYGLWLSVACVIGVVVGILAAGKFYASKMNDGIAVGGFVFDKKVYSIVEVHR